MAIIYVVVGLVLLVVCGEGLVSGAVRIAEKFHISPMILGMTVVAFGTSAPELIVSMDAAYSGHPEMAIGNVIGSNISNIALVLAMSAMILPIPVLSKRLPIDWGWMLGSSMLFFVFAWDNSIVTYEGIILFTLLLLFLLSSIRALRKVSNKEKIDDDKPSENKTWFSLLLIIGASGGLALGADLLIDGASDIARGLGVSERVISITLVAFGTSLPELAASCMAAIRKQTDISIGNIIGSNIFNVLAVIGITSIFKTIPIDITSFKYDFIAMLIISVMLMLFIFPLGKNIVNYRISKKTSVLFSLNSARLGRIGSAIFLVIYVVYVVKLFTIS